MLDRAASLLIDQEAHRLPNLASVTVVMPSLHGAGALARRLVARSQRSAVLLPSFTTLRDWAGGIPAGAPSISDARRDVLIYCALRERKWFAQGDLWGISTDIRKLMDELTLARVTFPETEGAFLSQLEKAYNARAGDAMHFEARLIHQLWYAMHQTTDGAIDGARQYVMQLGELARRAPGPLYVIASPELQNAERDFLKQYALRQPVHLIQPAFDDHFCGADDGHVLLDAAWHEPPAVEGDSTPQLPILERARAFRAVAPESPVAARMKFFAAAHLEQEAEVVALQIRRWLNEGKRAIGVVVQDRIVARRARALLERVEVLVQDETGWTFSTTAASTVVMRMIDAVASGFYYLDMLDLLKSPFVLSDWEADQRKSAVTALERLIRKHSVVARIEAYRRLCAADGDQDLRRLLDQLETARNALSGGRKTLGGWSQSLEEALNALAITRPLCADAAGVQLLAILRQAAGDVADDSTQFTFSEWRQWMDQRLEQETFRDESIESPVIFTHLAATRLRQFDGVILVGADAGHLPSKEAVSPFFNESVRAELGLSRRDAHRTQLRTDLIQLLGAAPAVLVTWQGVKDAEINLPSPYFERLDTFHTLAYGRSLMDSSLADAVSLATHAAEPESIRCAAPSPSVPCSVLPTTLSASGYSSLMNCPYQFFARHILRLNEMDEVQHELEKKDFGDYVHRILHRYHASYPEAVGEAADAENALREVGQAVFREAVESNFISRAWALRWEALVPGYVKWQCAREREGWRWMAGEEWREVSLPVDIGFTVTLRGRIDRIDCRRDESPRYALIDYKTQAREKLQRRLECPGEDVQLPFYAILFEQAVDEALYVSLDRDKVNGVSVPDPMDLAERVRTRLKELFSLLLEGKGLPAHGQEAVCDYCEMRGVCRRDYWWT